MRKMRWILLSLAVVTLLFGVAGQAGATVLTFDFPHGNPGMATSPNSAVDERYGDRVGDPSMLTFGFGYGVELPPSLTPNVEVDYGFVNSLNNSNFLAYTTGYGNLQNVAYAFNYPDTCPNNCFPSPDGNMVMTFIADPGYQVSLSSFDLAEWAGNPGDGVNIGGISVVAGSIIRDQFNLIAGFAPETTLVNLSDPFVAGNTHSTFAFSNISGQALQLIIDPGQWGLGNFAIDNVTYSQHAAPVPEPGTLLLLGFCLAGLGLWARKRISN